MQGITDPEVAKRAKWHLSIKRGVEARFRQMHERYKSMTPLYSDTQEDFVVALLDLFDHQTQAHGLAPVKDAQTFVYEQSRKEGVAV